MPRVILKEVMGHFHELFLLETQGVDKMLAIFKAQIRSLRKILLGWKMHKRRTPIGSGFKLS